MGRFTPTQNDLKDLPRLERTMRIVFDELYRTPQSISMAIGELEKRLPSLIGNNLTVIRQGLQADGTAPLNLTSLPGIPANASQILQDTHANRLSFYAASNYTNAIFWETDRLILYVSDASSGTSVWKYVAGVNVNTFTNRPADLGTSDVGFQFYASDHTVMWRWNGTAFVYQFGIYQRTQAQLAALAALLGANDAGYLVDVTDYIHILRWSGAAWTFEESDPGSGYVVIGKPDGTAPNGGVWGACDGTAYNILVGDGSLSNTTTQNLTGEVFIKGAAATAAQQAAARATWEATAKTDAESAHTHAVDPPSTTSGNNSAATTVDNTGGGSTVSVAADTHTHDTDIASFTSGAGSSHQHNLSDATAQLKVPSEANGGLPLRISCVFFMRR